MPGRFLSIELLYNARGMVTPNNATPSEQMFPQPRERTSSSSASRLLAQPSGGSIVGNKQTALTLPISGKACLAFASTGKQKRKEAGFVLRYTLTHKQSGPDVGCHVFPGEICQGGWVRSSRNEGRISWERGIPARCVCVCVCVCVFAWTRKWKCSGEIVLHPASGRWGKDWRVDVIWQVWRERKRCRTRAKVSEIR